MCAPTCWPAIIYCLPYITRAVPSPLVTIVVLTAVSMALGLDIRTVADMGQLPDSLPIFLLADVPLTLATLRIILPYAVTLAVVGLLESMMTASIVDELTDTASDKNRECVGQGVANVATGFIGGMAGCAMIGQSVINVKSGGCVRPHAAGCPPAPWRICGHDGRDGGRRGPAGAGRAPPCAAPATCAQRAPSGACHPRGGPAGAGVALKGQLGRIAAWGRYRSALKTDQSVSRRWPSTAAHTPGC